MKDKFKKVIHEAFQDYALNNLEAQFKDAANACNTLHQQAMKEERKKNKELVNKAYDEGRKYVLAIIEAIRIRELFKENNIKQ